MSIKMKKPHTNKLRARQSVDVIAQKLRNDPDLPGLVYRWDGDKLNFQSVRADGSIVVDNANVFVDIKLKGIATLAEGIVRNKVQQYLQQIA